MWEDYNGTGNEIIIPNVHTYNTVMADFAQLGHAIKFKQLLIEVLDHDGSKDTSILPNTEFFSLVIELLITNDAGRSRYNIDERLRYARDTDIIFRYPKVFFDITKIY